MVSIKSDSHTAAISIPEANDEQFNNDGFEFPPKHVIWIWIHVRCNPVGVCDEMKMNGECNFSWLFMGQPL